MRISDQTRRAFRDVAEASLTERRRVVDLVRAGQWELAEDDDQRAVDYDRRIKRGGRETHRGGTLDFLSTAFLDEGATISRAVGRITVQWAGETELGTGVMVAPGILMTNQHVLSSRESAAGAIVEFDLVDDARPERRQPTVFRCAPQLGYVASPEIGGLDYALVMIGEKLSGPGSIEALPYCPMMDSSDRHRLGMLVNIVQHPGGRRRVVALRENRLLHRTTKALLYETDTETGSSGAPVFNDDWELVALHHYGEPMLALDDGATLQSAALNEGVRISVIVADLRKRLSEAKAQGGDARLIQMIERVLTLGDQESTRQPTRKLLRPAQASVGAETLMTETKPIPEDPRMSELRITIPSGVTELSLTLKLGPATEAPRTVGVPVAVPEPPRLRLPTVAAERHRIDRNYRNRSGFDANFLDTMPINLEAILRPQANEIAPLLEASDPAGILKYQHFSLAMHRTRRLAILTATNIDGASYLNIDRKSKTITPDAAEGETWYTDPRMADEYIVTQDWYSNWSHLFDRGHLTRRTDPTWGNEEDALRAEKDTFHFQNCTPQHWRFNQSAKHWQGLERYVLEAGARRNDARLSVLQGPVFAKGDWLGDELQIPDRFWKLIAWRSPEGTAKSVAFVASQQELFNEVRRKLGANEEFEVGEFQTSVRELSQITGLDFSAFEPWDTVGNLPATAGEAKRVVRQWTDIRL